ncbi:hypothetical protein [Modicisalibacter coralii]|uniref:hypothetical protein n=1 Tax=Modicisalibacter coralii TaxID=2304602 RepID=UPI001396C4BD|nr:hypothetical protein [Halomonas coralii]
MIGKLLRLVPGWAWLALLAAVAGALGWWRIEALTAQRDAARAQAEKSEDLAAALQSALDYRRAEAQRLNAALADREAALSDANEQIDAKRRDLRQMEKTDAETRDWAAQPLPVGVGDWVRRLGEDRAGGDDAERAAAPADTSTGAASDE